MKNSLWQQSKPHVIVLAIFLVISCLYCLPALQGMVLNQYDQVNWKGMAQQSIEFKEKHGHVPLWTNSMFSGMPAFQIFTESRHNIHLGYLHAVFTLGLPEPASLFFLACLGAYLLCVVLGARPWVAALGALGYAFASYDAVIMAVGHVTKLAAMGYMPAVLAGLVLLARRKYVAGFITTLVFATTLTFQGHFQILYYTLLLAVLIGLAYAIQCVRTKAFKPLLTAGALAVVAISMGILSYAVVLLPTREFGKESMRGGRSELTLGKKKEEVGKGGLDRDYAFIYSYGVMESFSFVLPRFYGGSDPEAIKGSFRSELGSGSRTAEALAAHTNMPEEQAEQIAQSRNFSPYWGPQYSTSGANYLGAVIAFLLIVGLVAYRGWHLGWLVAGALLGFMMAWGKFFPAFNNFLFDYLPAYNKLRAPSMALVMPQLTIPILAALGLQQFLDKASDKTWALATLKRSLIGAGALVVLLGICYFVLSFSNQADADRKKGLTENMLQQMSQGGQPTPEMEGRAVQFGQDVTNALKADRKALFGGDLLRSLFFMALAAGILLWFVKGKLMAGTAAIGLTALAFIDLVGVDWRYLNYENYMEREDPVEFALNRADQQIKQDTGYFRVANLDGNLLTDSRTSYYHNNVGGYSAARLGLYEDLLNYQLSNNNEAVFNMLNTKYYIITDPKDRQPVAQLNPQALGPCWLVKQIRYVNNADEEMTALNDFHPADTVVIDKREQSKIPFAPQYDSAAMIQLVQNVNDDITYRFHATTNQFAVFSEVYYPLGWKAYVDGNETPIVKVNYALRGMALPAGDHTITFHFAPASFVTGDRISLIVALLSIVALLGAAFWGWKQWQRSAVK